MKNPSKHYNPSAQMLHVLRAHLVRQKKCTIRAWIISISLFPGILDSLPCFPSGRVNGGRVAPAFTKKRQHRLQYPGGYRRRRRVVQINTVHHPVFLRCQKFVWKREKLRPMSLMTKEIMLNSMVSSKRIANTPPMMTTRLPAPKASASAQRHTAGV